MPASINPLYANSTLITYRNTDDKYGVGHETSASGFFYRDNGVDYLVTNEHAVINEKNEPIDKFDILINECGNIGDSKRMSVDLLKRGEKIWVGHSDADIAIVPLEIDLDDYANLPHTKSEILPRDATYNGSRIVSGGESATVVGYPLGFTGENKLPVIRNAMISTPYGVSFNDRPCFLIDARMHDGMSGSPVLSKVKPYSVSFNEGALDPDKETKVESSVSGKSQRFLLGLLSETVFPRSLRGQGIDMPDSSSSDEIKELREKVLELEEQLESQIDLHRVWYADLIHRILNNG